MEKGYYSSHYKNYVGNLKTYYKNQISTYEINYDSFLASYSRDANVLDIGCGVGNFVAYLSAKGFNRITGVDSSKEEITICQDNIKDVDFILDSIENYLKRTDQYFDIISVFSLLEHIEKEDMVDLMKLIKSKIKKNGVLIFSTPNMGTLFGNTNGRYNDFTHTMGFTESSLKQLLLLAGFNEIEIWGGNSKNIKKWKSKILRKYYQPIVLKVLKYFLLSLDISMPKINDNVLYGFAKI